MVIKGDDLASQLKKASEVKLVEQTRLVADPKATKMLKKPTTKLSGLTKKKKKKVDEESSSFEPKNTDR